MERRNEMKLEFEALSVNEGFARVAVAAFCARMNPTLDELEDIKTAVSEAVTNAIIHGYEEKEGTVVMQCCLSGSTVHITVKDSGKGIADIERAKEPFFTTRPELERSGMGFSFMEAFMDEVEVRSKVGEWNRQLLISNGHTKGISRQEIRWCLEIRGWSGVWYKDF